MNTSAPANYVIRIGGHLGERCSASLVDLRRTSGTGRVAISGRVAE